MNKSNKCQIESSTSTEKETTNVRYTDFSDNPLSDISRYLDRSVKEVSSDNIELALEVEINENLKRALAKATHNSSDLLDVTIIRPSDSETTHETTVALNKTEVRDFISLVEQHRRIHKNDQQKNERTSVKEKIYSNGNGNGHRKKKHSKYDGTDESILIDGSEYNKIGGITGNAKQVYTTVNNFDKLKSSLACQNKNKEEDKPGTPCLCQHCGVVGVLVQSQKGPVATFPSIGECTHNNEPPKPKHKSKNEDYTSTPKDAKHRRITDLRKHRSIDQIHLLREINNRIKVLEKRIAVQEETAVPKDYLKHVLHKILTHYNFKQVQQQNRELASTIKTRNNFTQYSAKNVTLKEPKFQCDHKHNVDRNDRSDKSPNIQTKKLQVHTMLQSLNQPPDMRRENLENKYKENGQEPNQLKENITDNDYWFWGEEVVKPGCDLKNKILNLLEDRLLKRFNSNKQQQTSLEKTADTKSYNPNPFDKYTEKLGDIKIECDDKSIYLNVDDAQRYRPGKVKQNCSCKQKVEEERQKHTDRMSNDGRRKFNTLRNMFPSPEPNYPFDVKKTIDDSTFRKNIEAQKEKFKEKPKPIIEEKYFNAYACNSITTVSKASMEYIAQKMKNMNFLESGLTREKEEYINENYISPTMNPYGSLIKEKLNTKAFRGYKVKPEQVNPETPLQIKYVSPKIKHWSDGSSASDAKYISKRRHEKRDEEDEEICMEKKESLIYKLDFLKGLAKNKNIDQDKVFNRIWNQAKHTAKSKNDAVFIKIPIKAVNKLEPTNVVEMELTLEQLETVVKNAKTARKSSQTSLTNLRLNYKSCSDVDVVLRRHQEMKRENRNLLNSKRHQSAKSNKHKERPRYKEKI